MHACGLDLSCDPLDFQDEVGKKSGQLCKSSAAGCQEPHWISIFSRQNGCLRNAPTKVGILEGDPRSIPQTDIM